MRKILAAGLCILLLAACGGDNPAPEAPEAAGEASSPGESSPSFGDKKEKVVGKKGSKGQKKGTAEGDSGGASKEGGGEDDASSAWYPAAGVYTYRQSGWEEFCDASGCERRDLPATQDVSARYAQRSDDVVVVVTEANASEGRYVRTTTRYTREGAFVTEVHIEFSYENVNFENDYEPDPPVEVLRLPLEPGTTWSGSWRARTSGDYEVAVGQRSRVEVGGRTYRAIAVRSITDFRGDFNGRATGTTWIDTATLAIVKSEGHIDVDSFFGTYKSDFKTTLDHGPGYR